MNKLTGKLSASFLFLLASLLTGLVSLLAISFVWVKLRIEKQKNERGKKSFLADKQRALSFYKIFSTAYDTLNPYLYTGSMRQEIISQVKSGVNLKVLDVGCGTGYTTFGILQRTDVSEVVGLDMNPVQLKRAVKNLASTKRRTSISMGDAGNLPFVDESFDAVTSVGAIEYFPDPQRIIEELARVTCPGGMVVVGGPEAEWFSKLGLNRVFYTPAAEEVTMFFKRAGLLNVKSILTGVNTFFGTSKYVVVATGIKPS